MSDNDQTNKLYELLSGARQVSHLDGNALIDSLVRVANAQISIAEILERLTQDMANVGRGTPPRQIGEIRELLKHVRAEVSEASAAVHRLAQSL